MKKFLLASFLTLAFGTAAAAQVVFTETFESDGLGTRYSAAGAGNGSGGCCQVWQLNSMDGGDESDVLVGFEGSDFWAASDLDDSDLPSGFSHAIPRTLTMDTIPSQGLPQQVTITVALASSTNLDSGTDFLRVVALVGASSSRVVLDEFDGNTPGSTSGVALNTTFQDITYDLSGVSGGLDLVFEAWTTSNSEVLGIDNIRIATAQGSQSVPVMNNYLLILMSVLLVVVAGVGWRKRFTGEPVGN